MDTEYIYPENLEHLETVDFLEDLVHQEDQDSLDYQEHLEDQVKGALMNILQIRKDILFLALEIIRETQTYIKYIQFVSLNS